ncbi:transcription termination factor 3, mitochondrial-like [Uloborus diversus]|uniref:transcription termination factor 3, mitochondrial-like n=1 Tax=Uloborus diversus TaxID=327109 RepID=UPI00240A7223|nr:transcription termination factor 3, mitochondrial-like [Uloborus diversus]
MYRNTVFGLRFLKSCMLKRNVNLQPFILLRKCTSETSLKFVNKNETSETAGIDVKNVEFAPPKPFDEVPISEDANKIELNPAEFIDHLGPPMPVAFNLAAFVNRSETLMKLVQLGVDLSILDQSPKKAKYILKLDFEKDIKHHIQFLHDHGVDSDELGHFITKNPFIFKDSIENLEIRINYLKSKKFTEDSISYLLMKHPLFLSLTTKQVDSRLGFFQKQFSLTGDEVRHFITRCPKLISYKFEKILEKLFIFKELFGFSSDDMKKILLNKPKIWMLGPKELKERFDIVHNVMGIPQEEILRFPGVFLKRSFLLKQRHQYLVHLGRAQYDSLKPMYVSLSDIATTTDFEFCRECARTSVDQYNEFLKTL